MLKSTSFITLGLLCAAMNLRAGTPSAGNALPTQIDKSAYNLFNPTPEAQLRDFDTDRPDKTNSPHTLDAGHFQFETDLLSFTHNKDQGIRSENWTLGNANFRLGLTNWADLQFLIPFYQVNHDTGAASAHGIGDLTVGIKSNFWGNDGGDTAGGLGLFVKTPTASRSIGNGKVEGSAALYFESSLPADFDVGINTGVGITANDNGGYHADIINSISFSHKIAGPVSAYLEFFSSVPSQNSRDWVGTVDVGVTVMLGKNVQLDTGLNIGVTHASDDLQTFLGIAVRY